jgi:hypothetical protein
MCTFSATDIRALLERVRADALTNDGFCIPYQDLSPKAEVRASLSLVGDQEVHIRRR